MKSDVLPMSHTKAKSLAGHIWCVGGKFLRFKPFDLNNPGQPPWRTGAEGKAYPLIGPDGREAVYAKFFTRKTDKRCARTKWLIELELFRESTYLRGAPYCWADTRELPHERPDGIEFDLTASLTLALPGATWKEIKEAILAGEIKLERHMRWRCMRDLIHSCAMLEKFRIVHGDLSDNNIIVNVNASARDPALQLIDFDAFVSRRRDAPPPITTGEGGTYGTDGYCPPEIRQRAYDGDTSVTPESDRYGRDMLLLELLLFRPNFPLGLFGSDKPPAEWPINTLISQYERIWPCVPGDLVSVVKYLRPPDVLEWPERKRPSASSLALKVKLRPSWQRSVPKPKNSRTTSAKRNVRTSTRRARDRAARREKPLASQETVCPNQGLDIGQIFAAAVLFGMLMLIIIAIIWFIWFALRRN